VHILLRYNNRLGSNFYLFFTDVISAIYCSNVTMAMPPLLFGLLALSHTAQCLASTISLPAEVNSALTTDEPTSSNLCRLAAIPTVDLSLGFGITVSREGNGSDYAPSTGVLRGALMFVDFPDAPATETTQSLLAGVLPGAADWYATASYGRLNLSIKADMSKFHRMPFKSSEYGWARSSFTEQRHQKYIQDAINVFDTNGSAVTTFGKIDILYVMATRSARSINMSPTYMSPMSFLDGTQVGKTVTLGQDLWNAWGYKVVNHETGHALGLPDLYPHDKLRLPTAVWVGGWDLMALISGTAPDYFGWHKWKLGWLDLEQVDCISAKGSSLHSISPIEISGGTKMAVVRLNETAALVAEVRAPLGNDKDTCSQGLLLYTVNVQIDSSFGPIRVLDMRSKKTACSARRGGVLTGAAYDFTKGEVKVDLPEYGVSINIDDMENRSYKIRVDWK
jgi:M6 family metalloprotease-like protein